ncbi:MAG: hypothetical protein ACOX3G_12100 [Armatimonadota bacterium]|jgi:hypothetical protein
MASTNRTGPADFDERLAEAIRSVLVEGERVIAHEAGDQGQGIALTDSRIILVKAGLAATGELNGQRIGVYDLQSISSVNLRKGTLGCVIQISADASQNSADGRRPDNVIVFTGPGRTKRAEAFVSAVEESAQIVVNRVEPSAAQKPKVVESVPGEAQATEAVAETAAIPEEVVAEEIIEQEPEVDPRAAFNPNPLLPKSVRKHETGPNRMLVMLGVMAALVFVGMAVLAPLHETQSAPPSLSMTGTSQVNNAKLQAAAVANYLDLVNTQLNKADVNTATFKAALRSRDKSVIHSASRSLVLDQVCKAVADLKAPPGLAGAKEDLTGGLLMRKNAITAASTAAGSTGTIDVESILKRFDEADAQINRAKAAMQNARAAAEARMEKLTQTLGSKEPVND